MSQFLLDNHTWLAPQCSCKNPHKVHASRNYNNFHLKNETTDNTQGNLASRKRQNQGYKDKITAIHVQ